MALIVRLSSDLTGAEGEEEDFAKLTIRRYPGLETAVALDVLPTEVTALVEAGDVVVCELKLPNEPYGREIVVHLKDFKKLADNIDEVVKNARKNKGRRPGSRVS